MTYFRLEVNSTELSSKFVKSIFGILNLQKERSCNELRNCNCSFCYSVTSFNILFSGDKELEWKA